MLETGSGEGLAFAPGDVLGDYRFAHLVAEEEAGPVYLADGPELERVRLRILGEAVLDDPALRDRALGDLAALQEIVHPNVARFLAYPDEEPIFYALEHPGSATLFDVVYRGRPLTAKELAWVGQGLTAGVAALHAAGLGHGGISPGTIALTARGPVIVDLAWGPRLEGQSGEELRRADLEALAETLLFAAGGSDDRGDLVERALRLPEEPSILVRCVETPQTAWEAAEDFEAAAQRLGFDGPPDLAALLALIDASNEGRSLAPLVEAGEPESAGQGEEGAGSGEAEVEGTSAGEAGADEVDDDLARPQVDDVAGERPRLEPAPGPREPDGAPSAEDIALLESADDDASDEAPLVLVSRAPSPAAEAPHDRALEEAETTEVPALRRRLLEHAQRRAPDETDLGSGPSDLLAVSGETPLVEPPGWGSSDEAASAATLAALAASAETPLVDADGGRLEGEDASETGEALLARVAPRPLEERGSFGPYALLDELGRTPRWRLHLVRSEDAEQPLVLKVVAAKRLSEAAARQRFLGQVDALAAFEHPALVRIHDRGVEAGQAYLVEELVVGRALPDLYRSEAELGRTLLPVLVAVCEAVEAAAAAGIRTRVLRGADVLVRPDGRPCILDLGLDPRRPDSTVEADAEVRALGTLLYEVLTRGRHPTRPSPLPRLLLGDVPAPSTFRSDVPPALDGIALRALDPDPGARYAAPGALTEDLRRLLRGARPEAAPPDLAYRLRQGLVRHAEVLTAASVVILALVAAWVAGRETPSAPVASRAAASAEAEAEPADARATLAGEAGEGEGERPAAGVALLALGEALLERGEPAAARLAFERAGATGAAVEEVAAGLRRAEADLSRGDAAAAEREEAQAAEAARERAQVEEGRRLLEEGRRLLASGAAGKAREPLLRALALGQDAAEPLLRESLADEQRILAEEERRRRATAAADLVTKATDALEHKQAERARELFLEALTLDPSSARARDGLSQADQLARELGRPALLREARRAELARLLELAEGALRRGELTGARRAYVQALAHDAESRAAHEGLAEVERRERLERDQEATRRADESVRRARSILHQARNAPAGPESVLGAYLAALEELDKALLLVPAHEAAARERQRVVGELTGMVAPPPPPTPPPGGARGPSGDPFLDVVEGDRVAIDRALGGNVRFEPTRSFDPLREWVEEFAEGRYRVVVLIRSEVHQGVPPGVAATGVWVQYEDKEARTLSPWAKHTFGGGPHLRNVVVDRDGRIVQPFTSAHGLRVADEVRAVEERVKELLRAARDRS